MSFYEDFNPADLAKAEVTSSFLGKAVDAHVAGLTGKDAGWFAEQEADGSWIVERHFTEKRGMTYHPLVWAYKVLIEEHPESGLPYVADVFPANVAGRTIYDATMAD